MALIPLVSHATARPRQAGASSRANPGRPAGDSRARPAGTSQHYDLAHFHPGQAASSTESLGAECAKTQIALRDRLPRQVPFSASNVRAATDHPGIVKVSYRPAALDPVRGTHKGSEEYVRIGAEV
jgi:hypothetical protein